MYKHTQIGWVIIISLITGLVLVASIYFIDTCVSENWIALAVMLLLFISLLLFYTLTVTVDDNEVIARLGIGLFRKKILLKDIEFVKAVRNKWWYGWGIRLTGGGWMYNVSGLDAVQFYIKNKKKFRIGTDEPEKLLEFIKRKLTSK